MPVSMMWAVKVTRSTMAAIIQPGVSEDGSPFAEWYGGGQGDGGLFLPFGDHFEQQLRAFYWYCLLTIFGKLRV
jgi:hypothetical protein